MHTINRMAIVVLPREPFLSWARGIDANATAAVARADFTSVYLVNDPEEYDPEQLIRRHYEAIFDELLLGWYRDEKLWPSPRTEVMFHEWFEARIIDMVWDLGRGPIEKD